MPTSIDLVSFQVLEILDDLYHDDDMSRRYHDDEMLG